jgi:heme a synthase
MAAVAKASGSPYHSGRETGSVMTSIETADTIVRARQADRLQPVRVWLYAIAALVLLMVALGGVTRLTGSGLSITDWRPNSRPTN